jgi:glycosyltransferase involved in cell wall biosynthesis
MKRVIIDASRYFSLKPTGVEVFSQNLIPELTRKLLERGVDVRLLIKASQRDEARGEFGDLVVPVGPNRLWTVYGLSRYFAQNRENTLYVPSHTLPPILPKRSFIQIHDIGFRAYPRVYSHKQRVYLDISTRFALKFATGIFVDSYSVKNMISDYYHVNSSTLDKINVVYPGFSRDKFLGEFNFLDTQLQAEILSGMGLSTKKYILTVGRVESKKNFSMALRAFSKLSRGKASRKEYKIVFAGTPGHGFEEFWTLANQLGISENVILTGYISRNQLLALYNSAAAYYSPSFLEGFGFTALEAFSFNLPTVLSSNTSYPEVGSRGAIYIKPDSIDDNVNALEYAISNPLSDNDILEQNKALSFFSWEKSAEAVCPAILKQKKL